MIKQAFSRMIDFIESDNFVYTCTILILAVQTFISAALFHRVSKADFSFAIGSYQVSVLEWLHAFAFAFAIESAVLMLIVHARKQGAIFYALGSFLCCVLYFRDWEYLIYGGWFAHLPNLIATTIYSLLISCSVFYFSDLFAAKLADRKSKRAKPVSTEQKAEAKQLAKHFANEQNSQQPQFAKLAKPATKLFANLANQQNAEQGSEQTALQNQQPILLTEQEALAEFPCLECGAKFASQKALNAHKKAHKNSSTLILQPL